MVNSSLSSDFRDSVEKLIMEFRGSFDFYPALLSNAQGVTHTVEVDGGPIRQRMYRYSAEERTRIQEHVEDILKKDVIDSSNSPWASPVVMVRKKDGSWRFCIDYRRLNAITKKDVYPLPRIDDALDCLHGASYFTSLDLRSGYWQISVDERDREKTAFKTPDGLFQFKDYYLVPLEWLH